MEKLLIDRQAGVTLIAPGVKRLDASAAPAFKQEVVRLVEAGDTRLVLDLSGVSFLDSSGLGAMVSVLKALGQRGTLVVCGVSGAVLALFQLTRMDKVFQIVGSREDALARLGG